MGGVRRDIVGEKIHMVTVMRWNIDEMEEQGVSCLDIGGTGNKSRTVNWGTYFGCFLA